MNETGHEYKKKYRIIRPSVVNELVHGVTVSNLAYLVGKKMNLPEEECHDLAVAGFVHDIGKLELAQYVRGKENETLIIEELRYVRLHSKLGADILAQKGYSQKIVDMVKSHHENCDGSGYPMNLSREDIRSEPGFCGCATSLRRSYQTVPTEALLMWIQRCR